ncbi:MAG TPA: hypothetical protein VFD92_28800 [Candidatus Binatia bacterium]|nr:hypothetical protein [Candidatus Binatia bacterium]
MARARRAAGWAAPHRGRCGRPARGLFALALAVALAGCTGTLVERAVRARGGPLVSASREADANVHRGFPGQWSFEIAYRTPDRLRWTIHAYGEDQSYVCDGQNVRLYLGTAALPVDPSQAAAFRTEMRFVAASALDALLDPSQATWTEVPAAELPAGAAAAVRATFRDAPGSDYLLAFDDRMLLVSLEGDVAIPTIGAGRLRALYRDFRDVAGYTLPFAGSYTLGGEPLMEETVRRWLPNDPSLTPASFASPPP